MIEKIYIDLNHYSSEERAALALLASVFSGKEPEPRLFEGVRWSEVLKEMKIQAVAAIPIEIMDRFDLEKELFDKWLSYTVCTVGNNENILNAQSELTELFDKNNISMAVLKGAAAACYYPNPLYRCIGDIDFLVEAEDFEEAYELMINNGYELAFPIDHVDYHITLKRDEVMYELHREPAGLTKNMQSDKLREILKGKCHEAELCEMGGNRFYRLPRLYNGLVLLLHIVKHMDDGLGLRQVCDWLAFVNAELSDDVWEKVFQPVLKRTGLEKLAMVVTRMCKLYLGLSEKITWCDGANKYHVIELMDFVMENGNFGKKNNKNVRAMAYIGRTKETGNKNIIYSFFMGLQKTGMKRWKSCKRHKILNCVAWAYLPVTYILKLITGKTKLSDTFAMIHAVRDKRSIQSKLSIYK